MKKIIRGKRYDTANAILIGECETPGIGQGDFSYWKAGLYKTKRSSKFFLAGEGGAMTRFGHHSNGYGFKLLPMTAIEALEFAEKHLAAEDIEFYFKDQIEDA